MTVKPVKLTTLLEWKKQLKLTQNRGARMEDSQGRDYETRIKRLEDNMKNIRIFGANKRWTT